MSKVNHAVHAGALLLAGGAFALGVSVNHITKSVKVVPTPTPVVVETPKAIPTPSATPATHSYYSTPSTSPVVK